MNAPVGSRDPVYNMFCTVELITVRLLLRLVTSYDLMTSLLKKVTSIDQNSNRYGVSTISFQIVDRISQQSS